MMEMKNNPVEPEYLQKMPPLTIGFTNVKKL
ncbi:hypothetical protein J2X69_000818 [Algoriphagus sp. 4150]|nr:hypothetical protein [Algoriphagus sp. 4150]